MDQQQDLKELIQLYNSAAQLKRKAEKKLIRFTDCLTEEDKITCGIDLIDEINTIRQKIKQERREKADNSVRNSYISLQNSMSENNLTLRKQLNEKSMMLEQEKINFREQIEASQFQLNKLKQELEILRDSNLDEINQLILKNQQLDEIINQLNKELIQTQNKLQIYKDEEERKKQFYYLIENLKTAIINNYDNIIPTPLKDAAKPNEMSNKCEQQEEDKPLNEQNLIQNKMKQLYQIFSDKQKSLHLQAEEQFIQIESGITNMEEFLQRIIDQEETLKEKNKFRSLGTSQDLTHHQYFEDNEHQDSKYKILNKIYQN
ncbi:unnamed protein product (macronuclear) [Paramecium tetraurelia]|uniref:Uncharacterized protein n=1 Tax=Paramecium tetraurelia TaxID=5888 RepID=A0CLW7_PARTE|nr:uncharacterized protein GSPATT00038709001 [Paramecium tetraurelia]CAK71784.1 unnamed protein product [Paramecium tetraurelia]|eukprot:XP_001439181.1 hypothetical protein (macronuclear) [Paramecium tetraurelia strain d4-2]